MASRGLGSLTIDLILKTGGFTAGLDKAGRALDARTREMHRKAEAFGRVLGNTLKVGFGIAAAGFALYVKNTIEAEKVQAQLVARLKDTGTAAGRTLQQLNAQAEKLQSVTIFDDESIGQAQAALLTFTEISGLNFDRTIEAATDLATVMGTDVADAAKLLGKALSDPEKGMGALRKAGVVLGDDQKELVKHLSEVGNKAGAQRVILDALAGTMGSAAEAARNTLGGALQALTNSFNNLLEGNGGDDGVVAAKDALNELNATLNSPAVKSGFNSLITLMAQTAAIAAQTASAIANLALGVDAFGRSAAQAAYDANLTKEDQLKADIANGGRSPFAAGGARTVASLQAELAQVKRDNAAYRASLSGPRVAAPVETFALNGSQTVHADPSLFGVPEIDKNTKATNANAEAKRRAAEAARAQADRESDLRDQIAKATQAQADFDRQLEDLIAHQGGPLAESQLRYRREEEELRKLWETGSTPNAEKLAQAIAALHAERDKDAEAIRRQMDPAGEHLQQMQDELDLLQLQTKAQRDRAAFLLDNPTATDAQADAAVSIGLQIDATRDLISEMDDLRDSSVDAFMAIADGSESGIDALKHFGDEFAKQLKRMSAEYLSSALFGERGTTGGGLLGGIFSSLFGGFGGGSSGFGNPSLDLSAWTAAGYANGTDYAPGGLAWVGEDGPELMNVPRGAQIIPHGESMAMAAGGVTQIFNQTYQAPTEARTRAQVASDIGVATRRANSRNGVKA